MKATNKSKSAKLRRLKTALVTLPLAGTLIACQQPTTTDSTITGALAEESSHVSPAYAQLSSDVAYANSRQEDANRSKTRQVVKMGIFISYDKEDPENFEPFNEAPPMPMAPEMAGWTLTDSDAASFKQDYGTQAFDALVAWINNPTNPSASFLKEAQEIGAASATRREWRGLGPALAGSDDHMQWEVLIQVGKAEDLSADVGKSMGERHITLLNGHFYSYDASLQELEQDSMRPMIPAHITKNIYGRALDSYASNFDSNLSRRIVVFNGCGSEEIEKLVKSRVGAQPGLAALDLVGMRGRSNYRHFGPQIGRFLTQLSTGGNWGDVLNAMKFNDMLTADSETINMPHLQQVQPVICQVDGFCPDRPEDMEEFLSSVH